MPPAPQLVTAPGDLLKQLLSDPLAASRVPFEDIPALRGELARFDTLLLSRLLSNGHGHADAQPDRLLDAKEAAEMLGTSEDYMYRHAARLPFTVRLGQKQLRFSQAGIERYIHQRSGR